MAIKKGVYYPPVDVAYDRALNMVERAGSEIAWRQAMQLYYFSNHWYWYRVCECIDKIDPARETKMLTYK